MQMEFARGKLLTFGAVNNNRTVLTKPQGVVARTAIFIDDLCPVADEPSWHLGCPSATGAKETREDQNNCGCFHEG